MADKINDADNGQAPGNGEKNDTNEGTTPDLFEGIPDDHPVRKTVEELRRENASKRTSANSVAQENEQLKQKLASAKTEDDVKAAVTAWEARYEEAQVELLKERVARTHGVPDAFLEFLTAKDEETLIKQAEKLKAVGTPAPPATPPVGGRNPRSEPLDPQSAAEKIRQSRGRGRRR